MILDRDIWTELGSNLNFSDHAIESDDKPLKCSTAPMVDLDKYEFKSLDIWNITPE